MHPVGSGVPINDTGLCEEEQLTEQQVSNHGTVQSSMNKGFLTKKLENGTVVK